MKKNKKEEENKLKKESEKALCLPDGKDAEGGEAILDPDIDGASRAKESELKARLRRLPARALELMRAYRRDARLHIKESAVGFALGVCAYLLGSCKLAFGTNPLGLALLCASPKKIFWIFAGLCVSALGGEELGAAGIYVFAYVTAVAVRVLARLLIDVPAESEGRLGGDGDTARAAREVKIRARAAFTESIYLRMATGTAAAFIIGVYFMIKGSFAYYDLFASIFSMASTPLAIFVYAGCFEENECDKRFRRFAICMLMMSLTFSLRDMYVIGVSLGAFFAYFITLYVCRKKGMLWGALVGGLCGVAYSPIYAPLFVLTAITVGALWSVSAFGALVGGGTAGMLWGFYVEGVGAMSRLLPAIMLSSVCYMGARRMSLFPAAKDLLFSGRYCSDMNDAAMAEERCEVTLGKMTDLSDTFEALSEIFYNLSDRISRPGLPELRRMCDGIYDKYCPVCPSRDICWELEYAASKEMLTAISGTLAAKGMADSADVPEYMRSRCVALPGIIGEINHGCAELCRRARLADKTDVFAMDYAAVAALLSDVGNENRKNYKPDPVLTAKMTDVLSEYGFGGGGVSVYGDRRKRIVARGFDVSGGGIGMSDLKKKVEGACGFPVSDPIIEMKDNILTLKMTSARRFSVESLATTDNFGEEECGDTASTFENCDDRFYAIVSDGMGTGREAAFTSGVCSIFLRKMLGVGNRASTVIKMLSGFIRSKPDECSASADVMELDMLTGRAEFLKCGAAASFVRRRDNLFKLAAATLPLGILDSTDAGRLTFDVEDGDVIIMMSDGVAMGNEDCMWLLDMLSAEWDDDLHLMSRRLIDRARRSGSCDDISVILTKVSAIKKDEKSMPKTEKPLQQQTTKIE